MYYPGFTSWPWLDAPMFSHEQPSNPSMEEEHFSPPSLWLLFFSPLSFCMKKITVLVDNKLNTSQQSTLAATRACIAVLQVCSHRVEESGSAYLFSTVRAASGEPRPAWASCGH